MLRSSLFVNGSLVTYYILFHFSDFMAMIRAALGRIDLKLYQIDAYILPFVLGKPGHSE